MKQEMLTSFRVLPQMYLSYMSHNTAKGLVAISPSVIDIYFSSICGHISDKQITQECCLIHLLESGDVVMVDRGLIYSTCLLRNV